jgi:hypothetical protein
MIGLCQVSAVQRLLSGLYPVKSALSFGYSSGEQPQSTPSSHSILPDPGVAGADDGLRPVGHL